MIKFISNVKCRKERSNLNSRGFTLVELMIVVVIIAILTAFAVPIYNSSVQLSKDRIDEANVIILNNSTMQWSMKDEKNNPHNETTETLQTKLSTFLNEWPQSPNGKTYKLENGQWKVE